LTRSYVVEVVLVGAVILVIYALLMNGISGEPVDERAQ